MEISQLMQYVVKNGEDIYSLAIQLYGDVEYCVKLASENNLSFNTDLTGVVVIYDETIKQRQIARVLRYNYIPNQTIPTHTFGSMQSVYDVAIQYNYGLDNFGKFISECGIDVSKNIHSGEVIIVTNQGDIMNSNVNLATLYDPYTPIPIGSGIGWMTIGTTFIVG